jgi:hypothetical protein
MFKLLKRYMMGSYKSVGFIGLGMMGVPMVENLIRKSTEDILIYVNDVAEEPVKQLCEKYSDRVISRKTAKDIADVAVCKIRPFRDMCGCLSDKELGYHHFHGTRRISCPEGVPGSSQWRPR